MIELRDDRQRHQHSGVTRSEIISEFLRLSQILQEKAEEGVITQEEAVIAIDRYRERADRVLDHYREKVRS